MLNYSEEWATIIIMWLRQTLGSAAKAMLIISMKGLILIRRK